MKPLLKWTGGKFDEYKFFSQYIPKFNNYIEPFFGGGGVFFQLNNKKSYINDKSKDLVDFYNSVKQDEFESALLYVLDIWNSSDKFISDNKNTLDEFFDYNNTSFSLSCVSNLQNDEVYKEVIKALVSKKKRLNAILKKDGKEFTKEELQDHIETAVKGGIYMFFRGVINKQYEKDINALMFSAYWFFVREFCYASMFRYNGKGEFNIPYGGTSYNKKNIRTKIDEIAKSSTKELFNAVNIYNLDFDDFIKAIKSDITTEDFMFLDPPYDTEFSTYDNNAFGKSDQTRLRDTLLGLECKWMMVIKNTEFIYDLYNKEGIKILAFDKTYAYEVRGRNDKNKKVEHLIIMNY